jgi:4-amino-4-deoxy-L-arabinose transferase-like glycosyltransferase
MIIARRLALPAIIAAAALLALAQVNQHLILASDNASYIVLGQALAQGRGYVMVNEPLAPAMNLYPPGYPLVLAAILRLSGALAAPLQAVVAMKLATVFFYLASLPVLFALVRRRSGDLLAALTTLLFAVNPPVLLLATEILSEMPFVFCALLGLLALDTATDTSAGLPHRRLFLLTMLGALALVAAYYMRTAALAMLAAAPIYLLLKRRLAAGVGLAILLAALAAPWFLRSSAPPNPETPFFARSYLHQVLALAPYSDQTATPLDLAGRVVSNSLTYAVQILPEAMFPHLARLGPLASIVSVAIALLLLLGFVIELRRGLRITELAVAAYWLSLSLFVWVLGSRYVIIVLPFAFLYMLVALQWLAQFFRRTRTNAEGAPISPDAAFFRVQSLPRPIGHRRSIVILSVAVVLVASALLVDVRRAERNLRQTRYQTIEQVYGDNLEWTRYLQGAAWLSQHTPAGSVLMARKPDVLYLLTGHPTVEYPYTQDGAILMSTLHANHVSYILEDGFTWTRTSETYLAPAMSQLPGVFSLALETPAPRTRIWQVR